MAGRKIWSAIFFMTSKIIHLKKHLKRVKLSDDTFPFTIDYGKPEIPSHLILGRRRDILSDRHKDSLP